MILEKAMAPHSSTLAWKIPWTEEPGRLQSVGSLGVGHDWATSFLFFIFMHWRRKWQPMPGFLPSELHGQRSLAGCSPWGHKESGVTERLSTVYICQPQYSSSPAPISPLPVHMSTLPLCLYSCPAERLIFAMFLIPYICINR